MTDNEFVEQLRANKNMIHYVCNNYCATYSRDDLVQDIYLELWVSLGNFKNNCKFSTWLYMIARNVCISTLRKQKNHQISECLDEYKDVLAHVNNTKEILKQLRNAIRYNNVLSNIEQPYRELFDMYINGASFKELEQYSGISANNIRVHIHRIKQRLKLRYGNKVI